MDNGFDSGLQTSKTFSVNVTDASTRKLYCHLAVT